MTDSSYGHEKEVPTRVQVQQGVGNEGCLPCGSLLGRELGQVFCTMLQVA